MKRAGLLTAIILVFAGTVNADLAINWKNFAAADRIQTADGSATLPDGVLLQLIWTQNAQDAMVSKALPGGGLADGEVLLQSTFMGFGVANTGRWNTDMVPSVQVITDADVGGSVNSGYFFTRIFETAGAEAGTWYYDTQNVLGDTVYVATDTGTIYSQDALAYLSSAVGINANGTQVIPEPATVGLMGMAGLGMFMARKKAHS